MTPETRAWIMDGFRAELHADEERKFIQHDAKYHDIKASLRRELEAEASRATQAADADRKIREEIAVRKARDRTRMARYRAAKKICAQAATFAPPITNQAGQADGNQGVIRNGR